jgi:hypothetical protein
MTGRLFAILAFLVAAPSSAQMLSDMGPPQHRIVHRNTFALRVNPLGLLYDGRFAYRFRLFASEKVALRDNFVAIGIATGASPAFAKVGGYVEVQPLTVFSLWATYDVQKYFGTFNLLQSFPSQNSEFSDNTIRELGATGVNFPAFGTTLTVGANIQLAVGPLVVRTGARFIQPNFPLPNGDTVLYDQFYDLLMPNGRLTFTNDLDVLYKTNWGLIAGLRYTVGAPFYGPENLAAGIEPKDNSTHRAGPFITYRFWDEDGRAFNQPTIALALNWWLKHRYRTGTEQSPSLPYIALAFNVVGDLMPIKKTPQTPAPEVEVPAPAVVPEPAPKSPEKL